MVYINCDFNIHFTKFLKLNRLNNREFLYISRYKQKKKNETINFVVIVGNRVAYCGVWLLSMALISVIAQAGFKFFGQALVQFIMVWHLKILNLSFIFSNRSA